MPNSMVPSRRSDLVGSLDSVRPTPAKAGRRQSDAVRSPDDVGPAFHTTVKLAVIAHFGSVKAAAISLEVDASLMMREFDAGKFHRLAQANERAKAAISKSLFDTYGTALESPKARARRMVREARQKLDDLAELLEHIA